MHLKQKQLDFLIPSKKQWANWAMSKLSNEQTRSEKQPYAAYLLQISLSRVHTFPGLNMFTTPCHTQLPVWFLLNLTLNTYPNYSQLMKEKLMPPSSSLMQTGIKWRQRSSGQQIRIRSWLTDGGPQPLFITQVRKFGGGGVGFKGIPLKNEFKIKKNNLSPQFIEPLFTDNIVKPSAINVQFNSVLFI